MTDRAYIVSRTLEHKIAIAENNDLNTLNVSLDVLKEILAILKEHEKKRITLHKKHVITWGRNDEFNMRKLYEAICETLLDEGELFIARTDNHEKVDFVFYVAEDPEVIE